MRPDAAASLVRARHRSAELRVFGCAAETGAADEVGLAAPAAEAG